MAGSIATALAETLPFAGYPRVSRQGAREDERFKSPEFQTDLIRSCGKAHGVAVQMFDAEIDVSGAKPERAILDSIIAGIEAGELAGIIVAKLDRLSRLAPKDREALVERIEDAGGRILSASESFDASTPEGRFTRDLFFGIARMQWEKYAEGFDIAKASAVADGKYLARQAPLGYDFTKERRLVPNGHAKAVRAAFKLAGKGASYVEIRNLLAERTGRRMAMASIRPLLENRAYLGESACGRFKNLTAHKAIVTQNQFDDAQRETEPRLRSGAKSLLAGIAHCASCGRKMGSTSVGGTSAGKRVYRCPRGSGAGEPCAAPASILVETLDAYVMDEVRAWSRGTGIEERVIEIRPATDPVAEARETWERAIAERDSYGRETAALGLPADAVAAGLAARQETVESALEAFNAAKATDAVAAARMTVRELLDSLTTPEARILLADVIERVDVRPLARRGHAEPVHERANIVWR